MRTKKCQTGAEPATAMDAMWGEAATGTADDARLAWLREAKYSMFIHFGLYSHLGGEWQGQTYRGIGEWIMTSPMADIPVDVYKALASEFNPARFDARAIARLAVAAGMRCLVFTAKHHEGFAMYDSRVSDFTIARATPFGRDPLRELADACREEGLRLGLYYSQFQDWTEPDGGKSRCPRDPARPADFDRYFDGKVIPQLTELLTGYGPISVIWFDTPGDMGADYSRRLVELIRRHQPDCLINSRIGNGFGDYSTLGDMEIPTRTPEPGQLYECIDTTNNSWSYTRHDRCWKSPATIVRSLVRVIARDCCYMLNIGPDDEGTVPDDAVHALAGAGTWIRANREAIYGTAGSPFPPFAWGDCTVRGDQLYLHVFAWPASGRLRLAPLLGTVLRAECLGAGGPVPFAQEGDRLTLELPHAPLDPIATVLRLTLDQPPAAAHPGLSVDGEFPTRLPAEYAAVQGVEHRGIRWMETFGEWKKTDNLTAWTGPDARAVWDLDVLEPGLYVCAVEYACTPEAEGTEWLVEAENDRFRFVTLDTGQRTGPAWPPPRMRYRMVEQGVLRFARPGRQQLRLAPLHPVPSGGVWVTRLILDPWR